MWQYIVIVCLCFLSLITAICNLNKPVKVIEFTKSYRITSLICLLLLSALQYSFFSSYPSTLGWCLFAVVEILYLAVFLNVIIKDSGYPKYRVRAVFINMSWLAVYTYYFIVYVH